MTELLNRQRTIETDAVPPASSGATEQPIAAQGIEEIIGTLPWQRGYDPEVVERYLALLPKDAADYLRKLIERDALTQALNRNVFVYKLEKAVKNSRKNGEPMCLMGVDVDHFKHVNDTYGHTAGDSVLQKVVEEAAVLKKVVGNLNQEDGVYRVGGEEFYVILYGADINGGVIASMRLWRRFNENLRFYEAEDGRLYHIEGGKYTDSDGKILPVADESRVTKVTASIGVAQDDGEETLASLINRTDKALYEAKERGGRNRVGVNRPEGITLHP